MRDGRPAPVGGSKDISRDRQIAFGDHLVSKMQLFHTDMADEGLQHCIDGDSEFNPYATDLPENKPRPVLVESAGRAASPLPGASPSTSEAWSEAEPPGTEKDASAPQSASQGGTSASKGRRKKDRKRPQDVPSMQSLQPMHHIDDKQGVVPHGVAALDARPGLDP